MLRLDPFSMRRAWCAFVLIALPMSALPAMAADAAPCAIGTKPWLTLTITAGTAIEVRDRVISVRVHDNGCVELHRPAFYRMAGDYRLSLSAQELSALRTDVDASKLRGFDVAKVRAEVAQQTRVGGKSGSGEPENFAVLDGDQFALELHEGGKRIAAAWPALHDYAEYYPEVSELRSLSTMVKAAQALLAREDAVAVTGATR